MKTASSNRTVLFLCFAIAAVLAGFVAFAWTFRPGTADSVRSSYTMSDIIPQDRPELALGRSEEFDYDPPEPGSYALPVIQTAGDGDVIGPDGQPARLAKLLDGKINVLSFVYTRCADPSACPRASGMLREVQRASQDDPVIAQNVNLITMSFDPGHDTPDVMGKYGRAFGAESGGADWLFLTTRSPRELKPILEEYGQLVERKADPVDATGPLFHTVRVYLIDRAGRTRNIYSLGLLDPRLVLTDIRTLLLEELAARGANLAPQS